MDSAPPSSVSLCLLCPVFFPFHLTTLKANHSFISRLFFDYSFFPPSFFPVVDSLLVSFSSFFPLLLKFPISIPHYAGVRSQAECLTTPPPHPPHLTSSAAHLPTLDSAVMSAAYGGVWPEVSWREAARLMRIATSLFCPRCKKRVNGGEGPARPTDKRTDGVLVFAIMILADAQKHF